MKIPKTLKHKPVFAAEEYEKIDGRYAPGSDAKGLSLGLAQWNDRGRVEASAKVWRYTGEKWSRQSEELPLHRVLDLAILICKAKNYIEQTPKGKLFDPRKTVVGSVPLQDGKMEIELCGDNPMIDEDIILLADALANEKDILSERLDTLYELLKPENRNKRVSPEPKKNTESAESTPAPAPKKVRRAPKKVSAAVTLPAEEEQAAENETSPEPPSAKNAEDTKRSMENYLL